MVVGVREPSDEEGPAVGAGVGSVPARADRADWDRARERWRGAADALWPAALVDDEGYRRTTHGVGLLLTELRRTARTADELLAVDADPGPVLAVLPAGGPPGVAPLLLAAACAVRADEVEAERARGERAARLAAARREGRAWVELEAGALRTVELHVATGLGLVSTEDPLSGDPEPFGLGEVVLATDTGEPLAGHGTRETTFATRAARDAERERWRADIDARLDGDRPDGFG